MKQSSVSVVIPTFNRQIMLEQVLPTYLESTNKVQEIIIIDDHGTDDTQGLINRLATTDSRLRYFRNDKNLGAPASRNRGALLAQSEWILQSEDDLALGSNCIETLLVHAQQTEADIIAGRRIWLKIGENPEQAKARAASSRRPLFNEWLMDHNSNAMTTANVETPLLDGTMLIRRQVFDHIRYFEPFGGQSTWREESDFQLQALAAGYKLIFCPHTTTFHYSRASQSFGRNRIRGTLSYAYRVFHNNLIFLRRNKAYLRQHHPRALLLGQPELSAVLYGIYRTGWLFLVEAMRVWRSHKHGAFSWE